MFVRKRLAAGVGILALALAACSSGSVGGGGSSGAQTAASSAGASVAPDPEIVTKSQAIVDAALGKGAGFAPPEGGPKAQKDGAVIAYVGADLTNGGINAVGEGVKEAAQAIGWNATILDGKGSVQGRTEALSQAIALNPAGIVLGGFDSKEQASTIKKAADAKIPIVAWHGGPKAGPMPEFGVFTNVTTDAIEVSTLAAAFVVADSKGTAGVALYTDRQYDIAVAKSDAMKAYIEKCSGCSVLAYENSPIAEADSRMPSLVAAQLQQFGDKLTYLVGINGNYFGGAQAALRAAGLKGEGPPKAVAAGDGDAAEFQRIRNRDYQSATVAEPVYLQGWQLVDELNRAMAGEQASSFVAKPGLIVASNAPEKGVFDPDSGYRDIYKKNWGK
ncbi:MAG: substrate-binding domain-containing protein [Propionibacteriaceae bacterium]|nr:substrate-binding domain-containing protein [Propionibacteriaceae bacterium]